MEWAWAKTLIHHGFKVLEGLGLVGRVEGLLVPVIGEALGEFVPGLAAVLLAQVGVHAQVLVVVAALEVLMEDDHAVDLVAHVGLEDLGGDFRVIRHRDQFAHVVEEGGDDDLFVGAVTLGPRRGLQGVLHLINGEAVSDRAQALHHVEDRRATRGWASMVLSTISIHCSRVETSMLGKELTVQYYPATLFGLATDAGKHLGRGVLAIGLAVEFRARRGVCSTRSTRAEMAFNISRSSGGGGKYSSSTMTDLTVTPSLGLRTLKTSLTSDSAPTRRR